MKEETLRSSGVCGGLVSLQDLVGKVPLKDPAKVPSQRDPIQPSAAGHHELSGECVQIFRVCEQDLLWLSCASTRVGVKETVRGEERKTGVNIFVCRFLPFVGSQQGVCVCRCVCVHTQAEEMLPSCKGMRCDKRFKVA